MSAIGCALIIVSLAFLLTILAALLRQANNNRDRQESDSDEMERYIYIYTKLNTRGINFI